MFQNEAVVKSNKAQSLHCSVDLLEASLHINALYNAMLNLYMLQRSSGNGDVSPKVQVALLRLRTLMTRLAFLENKLESKIENELRSESIRVESLGRAKRERRSRRQRGRPATSSESGFA